MVLPLIAAVILAFVGLVFPQATVFVGRLAIRTLIRNQRSIVALINRGKKIANFAVQASQVESKFNTFVSKITIAKNAYPAFDRARNLYDYSVLEVAKYQRKLDNATTASQRKKYTKLVGRATTSMNRREVSMNNKYDALLTKLVDAGAAARELLNFSKALKNVMKGH